MFSLSTFLLSAGISVPSADLSTRELATGDDDDDLPMVSVTGSVVKLIVICSLSVIVFVVTVQIL